MVAICGKNVKVRQAIERGKWRWGGVHVEVRGFTSGEKVSDFMEAADCLITKAGPGTRRMLHTMLHVPCTLHAAHHMLHTTYYILHSTYCTLHTAHCILYSERVEAGVGTWVVAA